MTGFVKKFLSRGKDSIGEEEPSQGTSDMKYWLNFDSTGVKLHKETCKHVKQWAVEPKWKSFGSEGEAHRSTSRRIHKCGDCL